MPQRGIRLPVSAQRLPAELVKRNSDLDVMITVASESAEERTFGFQSTVNVTRRILKQKCPNYKPSFASDNTVLCRSGEEDGNPYRGEACFKCRASQFSPSGFFTGEMIDHSSPQSYVDPEQAPAQLLTLDDFLKSLGAE